MKLGDLWVVIEGGALFPSDNARVFTDKAEAESVAGAAPGHEAVWLVGAILQFGVDRAQDGPGPEARCAPPDA